MLGNISDGSLLDQILKPPENMGNDISRYLLLAKLGYPIALTVHITYLATFWYLDQMVMTYFNAVSVLLWAVGIWLSYAHQAIRLTFVILILVEVPIHATFATFYFGIIPAFYLYLVIVIMLICLAAFYERRTRIILSALYLVVFVALGIAAVVMEPLHKLPANWQLFFFIINATGVALVAFMLVGVYEWIVAKTEANLTIEYDRAEGLLRNILPDAIATKLKDSPELIAEEHKQVSVLFADIVNFTATSSKLTPAKLITNLNRVFSRFDDLVSRHGVEKIKTIGDAYMVVAGLPNSREDHATIMISLALDMLDVAKEINEDSDIPLEIRIGINSGPVVAGVIGHMKFAYDLWGDTVNVAARMEELGAAGIIQITQDTRDLLGDEFSYRDLGKIPVKGKGELQTYSIADDNRSSSQ